MRKTKEHDPVYSVKGLKSGSDVECEVGTGVRKEMEKGSEEP